MKKRNLIVLTGAGISAESGLNTFRDAGGLWENHRIEDVATPEAWEKNRALVLKFYNLRRAQLGEVEPNAAHHLLKELETNWNIKIITQNVDDLHERAKSSAVIHLHGELTKVRSIGNPDYIKDIGYDELQNGDFCPDGFQLRPHIVWFGEEVPLIEHAAQLSSEANVLLVIGTSLNVYPAAGLIHAVSEACQIILVDPDPAMMRYDSDRLKVINEKATIGLPMVAEFLKSF